MYSGRLRNLIEIQEKLVTKDATRGTDVVSWVLFAQAWAAADPLSARELIRVREFSSEITTQFEIRYLSGVTNQMRVMWDGVAYRIAEIIQPNHDRRSLTLLCYAEQQPT